MIHATEVIHALGFTAASLAGLYSLLALLAVCLAPRGRPPASSRSGQPPVTVLKPLCGDEIDLEYSLRSFVAQDYPVFQIVFGIQDENDPALAVARRIRDAYPEHDIEIVVDTQEWGSNRKVSNLANMMGAARYDTLVLADSDIQVHPDYLQRVTAPLADPDIGLVTCLYRGRPTRARWSRLSALFIDDWFAPSVLIARLFGVNDYAAGATLALRREDLTQLGGFAALANHLADDHLLGQRIRSLGKSIVLSDVVVETTVDEPSLASALRHEIRWMRTIRLLAPASYAFLFISCTLPTALCGAILTSAQPLSLIPLAMTIGANLVLHGIQNRRAGRPPWTGLWLWPLREALTLYDWVNGLFNRSIRWRGQAYWVAADGSLKSQSMDRH
ncbi:bacteriohopanetetrol glucosamine biosynthesis glycosyltransferase HpnI [Salinisphaera hydrothermalis]|uniref:bacteriohopanetetrol glucosamine biosynthesis glycosyltransferase HpnI n=1 Tax=Salinisphaera hydrothermalis TaxID=563188 RepID=UPI00068EDD12|nr:bacteriohopanetetrol glucosamine biosynthesis glycosyltransferase HpnI [Salinisphaera hydrothermalis]